MFYEEKVIDGILCYKVTPGGPWLKISYEVVLSRMLEAEKELEAAQHSVHTDGACTCAPDAIGHSYDCPAGGNPPYSQPRS